MSARLFILTHHVHCDFCVANYLPVRFVSPPSTKTIDAMAQTCKAQGNGWELVSIQDAYHVKWLLKKGQKQGVDFTVGAGVALGYDKDNTGTTYYDLRDHSRALPKFPHATRKRRRMV